MSDKHPPLTDKEALAKFKECFGYQAEPIETAYQEVDRITTKISDTQAALKIEQDSLEEKETQLKALWDVFYGKTYNERLRETTAAKSEPMERDIAQLKLGIPEIEKKIKALELELASALAIRKAAPLQAAKVHVESIKQRLLAVGLSYDTDIGKNFKNELNAAFKEPVDPQKVERAVKAMDARAEELCGPPELKKKQDDITVRLEALAKRPFHNDQTIGAIRILFQEHIGDIKQLNGAIEAQLKQSELQSKDFGERFAGAQTQLQDIAKTKALDLDAIDYLGLVDAAKLVAQQAATALGDGQVDALANLETGVANAQNQIDLAEPIRIACEKKFKVVSDAHGDFRSLTTAHRKITNTELGPAKGKITEAGNLMAKLNFAEALQRLDDAELLLDELNETVIGKVVQLQQKALQQQQAVLAQQAQQALENAPNVASLDHIGRDDKLKPWLTKAGALINLGLLSVSRNDPWGMNGDVITIEVQVTLTPTSPTDALAVKTFVVHYHPHADSTKKNPWGSPMHCKSDGHRRPAYNLDIDSDISWVSNYVPALRAIKSTF